MSNIDNFLMFLGASRGSTMAVGSAHIDIKLLKESLSKRQTKRRKKSKQAKRARRKNR